MLTAIKKPFLDYAPDQDVPLAGYAVTMLTYTAGLCGLLAGVVSRARWQPSLTDVGLVGIGTHKLARIVTKDFVTAPLRAPFTRRRAPEGAAEVHDEPRQGGVGGSVGYLLTCPYCSGLWIGTGLSGLLLWRPAQTRFVLRMLASVTLADFLHLAYSRLNESRKTVVAERKECEQRAREAAPDLPS